jgi:death-on-curing protein
MNSKNADSEQESAEEPVVHYLTPLELREINGEVTGDEAYVRDPHLLKSAAARPAICVFGQVQFPTLVDKAAALLHSLAYHHLFADGNKRTAIRAVTEFLARNGYELTWRYDEEYPYVLEVAQGLHDVSGIAGWLTQYVRPTPTSLV